MKDPNSKYDFLDGYRYAPRIGVRFPVNRVLLEEYADIA